MLNRDLLALGVRNIFTFEDLSDQGQKLIVLRTFGFVHKGENVLMMLGNDECPDRSSCDDILVDEVDNRERAPFEVWQDSRQRPPEFLLLYRSLIVCLFSTGFPSS
jgi:hypothetical protein